METKKAMRNRIYDLERANAQMKAELEAERNGDGELARLREAQFRAMTEQIRQMQRVVDDAIADVGRTKAEFDRTLRDVEELERARARLIGIANDENLRRLLAEHHLQERADAAEALAWAAKTLQGLCAAASGELLPLAVRLEDDPSPAAQEIGETLEEISRTLAPEIDWTDPAQIRALREKGGAADGGQGDQALDVV